MRERSLSTNAETGETMVKTRTRRSDKLCGVETKLFQRQKGGLCWLMVFSNWWRQWRIMVDCGGQLQN